MLDYLGNDACHWHYAVYCRHWCPSVNQCSSSNIYIYLYIIYFFIDVQLQKIALRDRKGLRHSSAKTIDGLCMFPGQSLCLTVNDDCFVLPPRNAVNEMPSMGLCYQPFWRPSWPGFDFYRLSIKFLLEADHFGSLAGRSCCWCCCC